MAIPLPPSCEQALLERFLRAEAMALWAVRSAQTQQLPRHVQTFLQRHEMDEQDHLRQFEGMLGTLSQRPATLPTVPSQWEMLAVLLFGYEALGLEFAALLAGIRPDLSDILDDEQVHVGFFEKELTTIVAGGGVGVAQQFLLHLQQTILEKLQVVGVHVVVAVVVQDVLFGQFGHGGVLLRRGWANGQEG